MKIEILTKKLIKNEIKKEVEKREFKTLRLINLLLKRINRLEEGIKIISQNKYYRINKTAPLKGF
jgi:hypothetical protein